MATAHMVTSGKMESSILILYFKRFATGFTAQYSGRDIKNAPNSYIN
jgi:hypothetical protein